MKRVAGVVVWLVVSAQDRAEQREQEAAALESYTDGLQPALDSVTPTANDMNEITTLPEGDDLDALAKDTKTWVTDLQTGQAQIQAQFAPQEAQPVNDLLSESIGIYIAAAETFALILAPGLLVGGPATAPCLPRDHLDPANRA